MTRRSRHRACRAGYALVELLVALLVAGLALAATLDVVVRQRRVLDDLASERASRTRLREGAEALSAELRALAPDAGADPAADGGDLRVVLDSAVELRALVGAAPACARVDAWTLDVVRGDDGPALRVAWWGDAPQPGDTALVLDEGDAATGGDDRWRAWLVADAGVRGDACGAPPLAALVAPGAHRLSLAGSAPLPDSLAPGTPVRVLRARRWSLYRAADLRWYLGMRERGPAGWGPLQPVSGPYDRHRPPAAGGSGLTFALEPTTGDSAIAVMLRATRRSTSGGATARRIARTDSLALYVAPRNGAVPGGG